MSATCESGYHNFSSGPRCSCGGHALSPLEAGSLSVQVLAKIHQERQRQFFRWGLQELKLDTGKRYEMHAEYHKARCNAHARQNRAAWSDVLLEEVYEALTETDPDKLAAELVQVAAVAAQIVEYLQRKGMIRVG